MKYIMAIDQSTQGTKALMFDESGAMLGRADVAHRQIVNEAGWVSHDMAEVYSNTIKAVADLIKITAVDTKNISAVGITNQRETSLIWDENGVPLADAIVWQCSRAKDDCAKIDEESAKMVLERTGIPLSPYYPAAKLGWLVKNTPTAKELLANGKLKMGTVDSWLVYKLTNGASYKTDYSNASRTQLFDIYKLNWDEEICSLFGLNANSMAQVCDSNSCFGETDFEGLLGKKIPIHSVIGDSHAALFGQGCFKKGMVKTTYGTGSSIMMNVGSKPIVAGGGVVASLAWGIDGEVIYVLEGNILYTGGVISWLKNNLEMIESAKETEELARNASPADNTYIVPAFTGLGAPYWDNNAKAVAYGMGSGTGRAEFVKAGLESIAYQINDVISAMKGCSGIDIKELRVDGGPTNNIYLMQFQSDISKVDVAVSLAEELSGIGAGYIAGIAAGVMDKCSIFNNINYSNYKAEINEDLRNQKLAGWGKAVAASRG